MRKIKFKNKRRAVAYWLIALPHVPVAIMALPVLLVVNYLEWVGNRLGDWAGGR